MTDWKPKPGDWVVVVKSDYHLPGQGAPVGHVGRVLHYGLVGSAGEPWTSVTWRDVQWDCEQVRLATQEERTKAQLASLEGL